jgi:hypothetical protein
LSQIEAKQNLVCLQQSGIIQDTETGQKCADKKNKEKKRIICSRGKGKLTKTFLSYRILMNRTLARSTVQKNAAGRKKNLK